MNVLQLWRDDLRTARSDLHATRVQALLVAINALAWRATAVLLPVAIVVAFVLVLREDTGPVAIVVAAALGAFGPLLAALVLTLPLTFVAVAQTWHQPSREARIRFGGLGGLAPGYYGWRYAYRGRTRPWGALTAAEKAAANPARAGRDPGIHG